MRFQLPFDDVQWRAAAAMHSTWVAHLRRLRRQFPPHSQTQRDLLKSYRDTARAFRRALLLPRDKIEPDELNRLIDAATRAAVEYIVADDEESI